VSGEARAAALPARVLVTGASRGIGAAIARALIAQGVKLAVVGRDRAALERVLGADAGHAVVVVDLARDGAEEVVDRAVAALGGLEGFVACAGAVEYQPLGSVSAASLAQQMTVNFSAPFLMAQRAAEPIARAGGGAMLFVASTLGLKPAPLTAAYAASKAALISAARSFALELAPRGIRVNALAPGVVDTDMVRVLRPSPTTGDSAGQSLRPRTVEQQLESLRQLHPLGRLGTPEEIAESALYLLRTPYVTGSILTVDGGLLLGPGEP
jgi:NAD(P)-dependent dehydrogenase (short-subunit alcohol dehydrogenase family)